MKYVVSRYNHDVEWLRNYTDDVVLYDRSEEPMAGSIVVPNLGSDIYDKFSFIVDNYHQLPAVAVYTKANLFKYITKEEFEKVKDNKTFTPLLTQNHKVDGKVNFYKDGMYYEVNNFWYLGAHPAWHFRELTSIFEMSKRKYNAFAPGSNYIVPRENILNHSKEFYQKLMSFLDWTVYPGDAQILERNLYYLWK